MAEDEKKPEAETNVEHQPLSGKVIKTVFLVLTWVMIGLFTEITGPTQKDLIIITDSDYELVSRAISGRSAGYFIGAVIGGPLVDKLESYCDLMIALSLDGAAAATIVAPYSSDVNLLWFFFVLGGTFEGIINIAGQKVLLNIWKEKSAGPLHILHFGFGMGSFIVPLIANPFLAVLDESSKSNETNVTSVMTSAPTTTTATYLKQTRIEMPYLIVGIIVASVSAIFFFYQFCSKKIKADADTSTKNESVMRKAIKIVDPGTCANGDRFFGVQIFMLLFFYFFNCVGGDRVYSKFIRSFAIDQHKFSGDDATWLNTEFWISYAVGRFLGLFTGRLIPIRILIMIEVVGVLATTVLLEIFAYENHLALWILTAFMGLFAAPIFPSGIGWGDFHVELTGFGITFILMGGALGGVSYLWVIGYLYEHQGHRMFLHHMLFYGCFAVVLTTIMNIIGKRHGGRFENRKEKEIEIENTNDIPVKIITKDKMS